MTCIDCHKRPTWSRERCSTCYHKAVRHGTIETRSSARGCSVPGCISGMPLRHGLCDMHYARWRRYGTTDEHRPAQLVCVVKGCECGAPFRRGMCNLHYTRWAREQKKIGV